MRLAIATVIIILIAPATGARDDAGRAVARHVHSIVPADGAGGVAVAMRIEGRTLFFNYGWADRASKRPITSDTLFNLASLRKVFEATLLAQAVRNGELTLEEPVAKYVTELARDNDVGRVTFGQLATHTSGLLLPQDHPPWPTQGYTLPEFIRVLAAWTADKRHQSGRQHLYTHAGFILLHLALERHFRMGIGDLLDARVLKPLGMADTTLPTIGENGRTLLPLRLRQRSVQGYSDEGEPVGAAGDVQGYYHWPGTAQMYSSARDMARFLAANLGDFSVDPVLEAAMQLAQRGVFPM